MPEGPELHLASLYVNKMCNGVVFTGAVRKSEVSKNPDVPFICEAYRITATSRGKEVRLTLTPMKSDDPKQRVKTGQADQPMDIVFRFGMSGYFRLTTEDELPKHAHLCFFSKETPCRVLSFVDVRRFGSWQPSGVWQPGRGPCIMFEYKSFRFVSLSVTACVTCSTKSSPSHSPRNNFAERTSYRTCLTAPLTDLSVRFCSIRSTSTVSGTTWGLKSFSGDQSAQPSDLLGWHIISFCIRDAVIPDLIGYHFWHVDPLPMKSLKQLVGELSADFLKIDVIKWSLTFIKLHSNPCSHVRFIYTLVFGIKSSAFLIIQWFTHTADISGPLVTC